MSESERKKLVVAAMTDLHARSDKAANPEDGTIEEAKAKDVVSGWHGDHPVVETAKVVDGGETWDYFVDLGDKAETEKGLLKSGDQAEIDPKKVKDDFTTKSGEEHKLYLRPNGNGGYELIMESTPTLYTTFINSFKLPENASEELKQLKPDALNVASQLGLELEKLTTGNGETIWTEEEFDQKVDLLADYTKELMDASYGTKLPKSETAFGPKFDGAFGSSVAINYLSSKSGGEQSTSIKYDKHGILDLRKGESGKRPYYLRGHLLNANLHGPNEWKNLAPLTYSANSQHKTKVENELTRHLTPEGEPLSSEQRAFKYIVIAQYGRGVNTSAKSAVDASADEDVKNNAATIKKIIDAEAFVPKHFEIKAIELEPNESGNWIDSKTVFDDKIPNDIDQSPTAYNVTGEERDLATQLPFDDISLKFLKKWFNDSNAEAIYKVILEDSVDSAEELKLEALQKLGTTDKRTIPLKAIEDHINFD